MKPREQFKKEPESILTYLTVEQYAFCQNSLNMKTAKLIKIDISANKACKLEHVIIGQNHCSFKCEHNIMTDRNKNLVLCSYQKDKK